MQKGTEGIPFRLIAALLIVLVAGAIMLALFYSLSQSGEAWNTGIFAELAKLFGKMGSAKVSVG